MFNLMPDTAAGLSGDIAFYGGSFDPPTAAHKAIVAYLLRDSGFFRVIVKPCGRRDDKPHLYASLCGGKRREELRAAFGRSRGRLEVDLSSLDRPMKSTWMEWRELSSRWRPRKVWIVCGLDLFARDDSGKCQIEKWVSGKRLFSGASFLVFPRPLCAEMSFPEHCRFAGDFPPMDISSSELRGGRPGTDGGRAGRPCKKNHQKGY